LFARVLPYFIDVFGGKDEDVDVVSRYPEGLVFELLSHLAFDILVISRMEERNVGRKALLLLTAYFFIPSPYNAPGAQYEA
jgi:hypothetical protein